MDIKGIVCKYKEEIIKGIEMLLDYICKETAKGNSIKVGNAKKTLRFYIELLGQAADDEEIDPLERKIDA